MTAAVLRFTEVTVDSNIDPESLQENIKTTTETYQTTPATELIYLLFIHIISIFRTIIAVQINH